MTNVPLGGPPRHALSDALGRDVPTLALQTLYVLPQLRHLVGWCYFFPFFFPFPTQANKSSHSRSLFHEHVPLQRCARLIGRAGGKVAGRDSNSGGLSSRTGQLGWKKSLYLCLATAKPAPVAPPSTFSWKTFGYGVELLVGPVWWPETWSL